MSAAAGAAPARSDKSRERDGAAVAGIRRRAEPGWCGGSVPLEIGRPHRSDPEGHGERKHLPDNGLARRGFTIARDGARSIAEPAPCVGPADSLVRQGRVRGEAD